jgi:hypothetical protein
LYRSGFSVIIATLPKLPSIYFQVGLITIIGLSAKNAISDHRGLPKTCRLRESA